MFYNYNKILNEKIYEFNEKKKNETIEAIRFIHINIISNRKQKQNSSVNSNSLKIFQIFEQRENFCIILLRA